MLIAHILNAHGVPFMVITAGFQEADSKLPVDLATATAEAERMVWPHERVLLSLAEAKELFATCARILAATWPMGADGASAEESLLTPVHIGVGAVTMAGLRRAKELGCTLVFSGLGAEETLGGYDRHVKAAARGDAALQEECWRGLVALHAGDLRRDCAIAYSVAVKFATPFIDFRVIAAAMRLPGVEKIGYMRAEGKRDSNCAVGGAICRKLVLRRIAENLGVPHAVAFSPKRAAQYGSRMDVALARLARKAGLQKRQYVRRLAGAL